VADRPAAESEETESGGESQRLIRTSGQRHSLVYVSATWGSQGCRYATSGPSKSTDGFAPWCSTRSQPRSSQGAIAVIKEHMGSMYRNLEEQVDDVLDKVVRFQSADKDGGYGALVPIEPQIVNGVDSRTFRHKTGSA
jgi:hypothetical protein